MRGKETENQNLSLFDTLTLVLIWVILIGIAVLLAAKINSFWGNILGQGIQKKIEAPLVEEFLKSLGLVTLIFISNKIREYEFLKKILPDTEELKFLKSFEWIYLIGLASGLLFGFFENYIIYGFEGLRLFTPFLHAFYTSFVAIGIYFAVSNGRKGIIKLIFMYFAGVSIHVLANYLSLRGLVIWQKGLVIVALSIILLTSVYLKHHNWISPE